MSRKNTLNEYQLVPTKPGISPVLTGSLSAAFVTAASNVVLGDAVTYQINITSSDSTGSFFVQASNDGVSWADVGVTGVVAAANDTAIGDVINADCFYYRVRYAPTIAGTGTCVINVSWKAKGG